MRLRARYYAPNDADLWDSFCIGSDQATFLHSRLFLSYHGERFADRSLIFENDGKWVGVLPAAEHPSDPTCVVSHPGITYGGLLHSGTLRGEAMVEALREASRSYAALGYRRLLYKAVPSFYHVRPAQDDLYALFRLGAVRVRCDLTSSIDLLRKPTLSDRRRRSLKKAKKAAVRVSEGQEHVEPLWTVLSENLARKHGVAPVHSAAEMSMLMDRFPHNIRCVCALLGGTVEAGVVIFSTRTTDHAQYIGSSLAGYETAALDAVFDRCIDDAIAHGKHWFDFGISTEDAGRRLNSGLYIFKTEFGAGGFVHEFFELALQED